MPKRPVARNCAPARKPPVSPRPALALVLLLATLSAIVLLPGPQPEDPGRFIRVAGGQSVPGEIVVRFHDGIPQSEWPGIAAAAGATLDRDLLPAGYARVTVAPGHEEAVGAALAADPRVRSAEEIATRRLMFVPNDEYYDDQWNLSLIQMERAWDLSTGAPAGAGGAAADEEGVVVAVLDSGVAFEDYTDPANHREYKRAPDLALTEFIAPYDAYDGDTHPNDDNGHGTHVTGTIAQATNNAIGVAGIAFNARIMPVKVCGDPDGNLADDRDYFCPDDAIAEGIIYAVNNGARVINLSLGGETPIGEGSLHRQALDYARAANVPVVAAAGNGGDDFIGGPFLAYPAAIASVISVGAAGSNGQKASYSDYGLGEEGNTMDLVAPGGDGFPGGKFVRQNTYARKCSSGVPINFTLFAYCDMIGTSQATAHVTGVVALIRARYPNLSSPQVRSVLHCSALDVGQPGDDLQHGHGLVQAYWALLDSDGDNLPNCLDPEPGVECFAPQSTPTPEPTPAPTETTIPTETATPAAESDTPAPVLGPAGPVPTDTPTPPPTDTPAPPTDTPAPATDTPTPVPPTDTPTPLATEPPTPTPTDTPTPEPTATPQPSPVKYACGDVDCDLDLDAVDALFLLRLVAALEPYAVCIDYGNVDCDEGIDAVDGLGVLRKIAGLPVTQPPGCPALGYS